MGVMPAEAALFHLIRHGPASPLYLPMNATSDHYSMARPVTQEEAQVALTACLGKGWLQVIDDVALAKIAGELQEGRLLGPINGLPEVGDVDFTHAGAELWKRL